MMIKECDQLIRYKIIKNNGNIIKNTKMFNFDYITKEDIKEHNTNWPEILDRPYRIFIIGGSGSGKKK